MFFFLRYSLFAGLLQSLLKSAQSLLGFLIRTGLPLFVLPFEPLLTLGRLIR